MRMVVGTGKDIVAVDRIAALIDRRGRHFLDRWFTPDEVAYCSAKARPHRHFAATLAAKEAVFKALPLSWDGPVPWRSIEISQPPQGLPAVRLTGRIEDQARRAGVTAISVSLSHSPSHAMAIAVTR